MGIEEVNTFRKSLKSREYKVNNSTSKAKNGR
jgi:hypothetical protein